MTVTYTREVATVRWFGVFVKLLFRWKGSIYKLIWPELILYIVLYYLIRSIYMFVLSPDEKEYFEKLTLYCRSYSDLIPLSFVLGFYVSIVMTRWWAQYDLIPYPDNLAIFISTCVHGMNDKARLMRRTIMRYVNLSFVMNLSMISPRAKKRFPTLDHLVEAGFLLTNEKAIFEKMDALYAQPKYWMPLVWAGSVVSRARMEGNIKDDFAVKTILDTINAFRTGLGGLLKYDRLSIPLVYTQVVTLAVYSFFLSTLISAQYIDSGEDFYVPWFPLLQYFFYMGWLKVAETMVNPFGEDDDDFEINWIIDRNLQISYLIVDEMHCEHPELIQDKYWDEICPVELPYTVATEHLRTGPHLGSTFHLNIPRHEQYFVKHLPEEEDGSDVGLSTPGMSRKHQAKIDEEAGHVRKLFSLTSIDEDKTEHDGMTNNVDNDSVNGLWITPPPSLKKSASILSQIFRQQHPHKRLSAHRSNPIKISGSNQSTRGQHMKGSLLNRRDSSGSKMSKNYSFDIQEGAHEDEALFHMSLESLKEADREESNTNSISCAEVVIVQPSREEGTPKDLSPETGDTQVRITNMVDVAYATECHSLGTRVDKDEIARNP